MRTTSIVDDVKSLELRNRTYGHSEHRNIRQSPRNVNESVGDDDTQGYTRNVHVSATQGRHAAVSEKHLRRKKKPLKVWRGMARECSKTE